MNLEEIDLAKVLLAVLDINLQQNNILDKKLNELFCNCEIENDNWKRILQKYNDIIKDE